MSKSKKSLSEQIAELSTPKPVTYHPDEEELTDITAARVCNFSIEDEPTQLYGRPKRRKIADELAEDPRYSGKAASRRDLQDSEDSSVDEEDGFPTDELGLSASDKELASGGERDKSISKEDHVTDSDQSEASVEDAKPKGTSISTISLESLKEDIAKGKAAKHQLALWDGLLETRIKLQKVLGACNQLPHSEHLDQFVEKGGSLVQESLENFQSELQLLLDDLLDLQQNLLLRNPETASVVGGASCHDDMDSDEEIPSDSEPSGSEEDVDDVSTVRKRRHGWVSEDGNRDYESYVSRVHDAFKSYRDDTIAKWNSKTRIAGGKVTNKSFVQVDQTVLSQIKHILADKPRLLKRTQLKRSVYRVLGTCDPSDGDDEGAGNEMDQSEQSRDAHLKDYDEEIFDDDDFYHQLLRELIQQKMDLTESSDPVAMGRQWLQLQRLRAKAKKKVDTKASKGRKIRYNVHPKLANFMVPVEKGTMSDVSKNDLFSSLFGAHQQKLNTLTT